MSIGARMAGIIGIPLLLGGQVAAADLQLAVGASSESSATLKLEVDRQGDLARWHPRLGWRLATGLLLLGNDGNAAWTLSPALRWTFAGERRPFLEAGIGAALFLESRHESRELGSAFQFEDRLALGGPLGRGEVALSLTHYSNGGIRSPNQGFEVLAMGYRLPL